MQTVYNYFFILILNIFVILLIRNFIINLLGKKQKKSNVVQMSFNHRAILFGM